MKKVKLNSALFLISGLLIFFACSTEKNTYLTRAYHNLTTHYNVYFNGREAFRKGVARIENNQEFDFSRRLPVYILGKEESASSASSDMDKAIEKASKGIKRHSITAKPKYKDGKTTEKQKEFMKKNEYNKWIDDSYMLMGKAYFVKNEFLQAQNNFKFIIRQFPNNPIRFESMIWLGRTALATGNLKKTKEWLDEMDAQDEFPEDLKKEYEVLYVAYYLELNNTDRAIPHLKKAIKLNKDKNQKIRHNYLLAQLYKEKGDFRKAAENFEYVKKKSNYYEMEFNAIINMAECYGKLGSSYKDMKKLLTKMLKDDKNIEYLDQVYYALAEVEYKNNNTKEAIENYKKSSTNSVNNNNQKAISCMKLGDIYFEQQDYRKSQAYYDTCMMNLSKKHSRYEPLSDLSRDLNNLIDNVSTVERQDSLQAVAKMPKEKRNAKIDSLIQQVIKEEQKQQQLMAEQRRNSMLFDQRRGGRRVNAPSGGKWYFYNPATLSFGANEFQKKWGKRKLEDHWRRSDKSSVGTQDVLAQDSAAQDSAANKNKVTDNKSREYYLQELPLNDSLLAISNSKIREALFNTGEIYMEDFNDWDKSIEAFESLNSRFPDHEYKLLTYYNLYELYKKKNNNSKAQTYKQKVTSLFPDSHYAKILKDPNYISDLIKEKKKQKDEYNKIYQEYRDGNIASARTKAKAFKSKYPESEVIDKVEFINILSNALNIERVKFKKNLASFIRDYPESSLNNRASKILGYLGAGDIDSLLSDLEKRPDVVPDVKDTVSSEESMEQKAEKLFDFNKEDAHYYVISANTKNIDTKQLRFEVNNFNIFTFNIRTFRVLYSLYDENTELIFVKSFKNKTQAMNYMKLIVNNQNVFGELNQADYSQFVISEKNFEILKSKTAMDEYISFYNKYYLK